MVIGIFIIAKIIELLLKHFESYTYCAILGLVISSPVVILMGTDMARVNVIAIITGIIALAAGALAAKQLGKCPSDTCVMWHFVHCFCST